MEILNILKFKKSFPDRMDEPSFGNGLVFDDSAQKDALSPFFQNLVNTLQEDSMASLDAKIKELR